MGTNYYCQIDGEKRHIGKSSAGWCFALHTYPELGINTLEDWVPFPDNIVDEYGGLVLPEAMYKIIQDRSFHSSNHHTTDFLALNHAVPGPNNLLRSQIDKYHCVGHGEGTWDYHIGEFS